MKQVALILLLSVLSAGAGDYFPYRPKRFTYEFIPPFDEPHHPKLPAAKLTVVAQTDPEGRYPSHLGVAALASVEVDLGHQHLSVPKHLLRDLGPFNLNTLDFYWVGGRHYINLARANATGTQPQNIEFVFRDGTLVDLWIANKSQRDKYPKLFEGTSPFQPETPKAK